jgi:hypothetical protein
MSFARMSMRGSSTWHPITMDLSCDIDCMDSRAVLAFFRGVEFSPSSRVSDFRAGRISGWTAGWNLGRSGVFNPPEGVGDLTGPVLARRRAGWRKACSGLLGGGLWETGIVDVGRMLTLRISVCLNLPWEI